MMHAIPRDRLALALFGAALACIPRLPAAAQSIDYGALEQLFGEPVTLSVTGKPQRATDAPATVDIITQDDIRRSGATSIPEVLQFVTGVDVRRTGFAAADVGIRGYNQTANPHLMVLLNGRQVYMVDYGRVLWATLPVQLDEIRQIEVIKGPNSALYGFNAVGGAINIITYDPLRDDVNVATIRGGTQDYAAGSAVATGRIGDTAGLRLSLGGFRAREFAPRKLTADDAAARRNPFSGSFAGDGRWQVSDTVELFAESSFGDTRLAEQAPPGPFQTERLHTNSVRVGVNAETGLGLVSLSAYRSEAWVRLDNISLGRNVVATERQTSYVLQATDVVKLGANHTLRLGLEYRNNLVSSWDLATGHIGDEIYAASLMWDWQLTPALSLTNAVRVDHLQLRYSGVLMPGLGFDEARYNRTTLTAVSFNSGLVWRATDRDTFRLSAARGVQLPTLLAYGLQISAGDITPLAYSGRPDLRPSIVWNVGLDYDRALPALSSTLRTSVFAQRTDDVITWPFSSQLGFSAVGVPTLMSANAGYSMAAGFEIGVKGHADSGWRWGASYALVGTSDHTGLNAGPVPNGIVDFRRSAPSHVIIASLGYTMDRWEADLMARWQSSFIDFRMTPDRMGLERVDVDNFITMNARLAYQLTGQVTLAATVQQLNSARLVTTAGAPLERRAIISATLRF